MARHAISQSRLNCLKLILLVFLFSILFLSQILVFIDTTAVPSPDNSLIEISKLQIEQQQLNIIRKQQQLLLRAKPASSLVVETNEPPSRSELPSNSLHKPVDPYSLNHDSVPPPPKLQHQLRHDRMQDLKNKEQQLLLDKLNNAQEASALAKELRLTEKKAILKQGGFYQDDYTKRLHPSPLTTPSTFTPVPLLVGGSDGSGTRSVVSLLEKLGVDMIIDDTRTNDVHGQEMVLGEGWPAVVSPVLKEVFSADYDFYDGQSGSGVLPKGGILTSQTREFVRGEIEAMNDSHRRQRKGLGTSLITYGIKAPVSMLLVPAFLDIWRGMKFIHVVRDGRDIAFSGNQSPVNKFYKDSYPDGESRWHQYPDMKVKSMQLWSDWNADLLEWERRKAEAVNAGSGENFDFLLLRLEDLLDSDTRFEQIKRVASFVGSPHSDAKLCCISMEGEKDLGSHSTRGFSKNVKERYGKWRGPLENDRPLSNALHSEGKRGLSVFGYEPWMDWMDQNDRSSGFICNKRTALC